MLAFVARHWLDLFWFALGCSVPLVPVLVRMPSRSSIIEHVPEGCIVTFPRPILGGVVQRGGQA